MDAFFPDKEEFYTIIHFHGGGLVEGDKGDTHDLCRHLANKGFAVFTCNYHLLPEHKFPEFLRAPFHSRTRWHRVCMLLHSSNPGET